MTGREAGRTGVITKVARRQNRVYIQGVNLVKKHVKPQGEQPGGIVDVEAPLHMSNVAVIDPSDGYVHVGTCEMGHPPYGCDAAMVQQWPLYPVR